MAKQNRRRLIVLIFLITLGIGLGLGLGLRQSELLPTTVSTTTSVTTVVPTTTPTPFICPTCNSSYVLFTDINAANAYPTFYYGQIFDYYVAGETFTYMNTSHSAPYNITLTQISKCTGVQIWSHVLCEISSGGSQYIAIDQTNGDVYFAYLCNGVSTEPFFDKYSGVDGTLVWRKNMTMFNATSLLSPITLNYDMQQLYIAFQTSDLARACAQSMIDGTIIWCYANDTYGEDFSGFAYDTPNSIVYVNAYVHDAGPSAMYVQKLNSITGVNVGSVTTVNLYYSIGIDIDANGGIYLIGENNNYAEVPVEKFDSVGSLQWRTVVVGTSTDNLGFTFFSRDLIYDPLANLVIVAGDTCRNCAFSNYTYNLWLATFDAASGAQLSYFEPPVIARTNDEFISISADFEHRTVYYSYIFYNRTSSLGTWQINTWCY